VNFLKKVVFRNTFIKKWTPPPTPQQTKIHHPAKKKSPKVHHLKTMKFTSDSGKFTKGKSGRLIHLPSVQMGPLQKQQLQTHPLADKEARGSGKKWEHHHLTRT